MLLAVVTLTAAGYVHLHLPRFIARRSGVIVTRLILLAVGIASGIVAASLYPERSLAVLAFVAGFGVVHVPAAFVLLLKRARGSPRS